MASTGVAWGLTEAEREIFVAEAEEFLTALEAGALEIEHGPMDEELLHLMFRAAHTLKGNAGMAGHQALAERTHALEQLLDDLRSQRIAPTSSVVQSILSGVDDARRMLAEFAKREGAPPSEAPPEEEQAREPGPSATGAAGGTSAFRVTLSVPQDCAMPAVRLFQAYQAIARAAQIVSASPPEDALARYAGRTAELELLGADEEALRAALLGVPEVLLRLAAAPAQATHAVLAGAPPDRGGEIPSPLPGQAQMVRVRVETLDHLMNLVGELVMDRARIAELSRRISLGEADAEHDASELERATQHLGRALQDLQESIMQARMLPVDNLFRRLPRLIRDLSQKAGRDVRLEILGGETELDRMVLDELGDALTHLLRNAVDHGIEPPELRLAQGKPAQGVLRLTATAEEGQIVVTLRDDGRGIDPARVREAAVRRGVISREDASLLDDAALRELIFAPGFSTVEEVTEISGRGVGLDAVRASLEKISGNVELQSEVGVGTVFRLRIPLTLAIMRALLVASGQEVYALPLGTVQNIVRLTPENMFVAQDRPVLSDRGRYIGVASLRRTFAGTGEDAESFGVVLRIGQRRLALAVEQLLGEQEIVLKPLGHLLGSLPVLTGAALLPSGDVALVLDVAELLQTETRA